VANAATVVTVVVVTVEIIAPLFYGESSVEFYVKTIIAHPGGAVKRHP
jgi:hypothetical protein